MATYYVGQSASGAANGSSVSNASAISTLNAGKAPYNDLAGDTCYLIGSLTTYVNPQVGGVSGSPSVIRGDLAGSICSIAGAGYGIRLNGKSYVDILGFGALSGGSTGNGIEISSTASNVSISNSSLGDNSRYGLTVSGGAQNVGINNCAIPPTCERWGVYVYGTSPANFKINGLDVNGGYGLSIANVTGSFVLDHINIDAASNWALYLSAISATNGHVNDLTVNPGVVAGVNVVNSSGLSFNRLSIIGTAGLYSGLSINGTSHNIDIYDSVISGTKIDGFLTDGSANNIQFIRCVSSHNGSLSSTTDGDGFTSHSTNYNISVLYSLSHHNNCSGCAFVGESSGVIANCTLFNNGMGVGQVRGEVYIDSTGQFAVKNNIVYNDIGYSLVKLLNNSGQHLIDYNIYIGSTLFQFSNNGSVKNFHEWVSLTGYDSHSWFILKNGDLWDCYYGGSNTKLMSLTTCPIDTSTGRIVYSLFNPAMSAAGVIPGINTDSRLDLWGSETKVMPNIGADQFDYAPGFGPWTPFDGTMPALSLADGAPVRLQEIKVEMG